MMHGLDELDRRLLTVLQRAVPLVRRPWDAMAEALGAAPADVLARVQRLRSGPDALVRHIGAIFDARALGYSSTLVGARVPADRLEQAAAVVALHPGVTHCYQREHQYNLWYTLAVPPDSILGIERTVRILHRRSGADLTLLFPALKVYKIGVAFDLTAPDGAASSPADAHNATSVAAPPDPDAACGPARTFARVLQQDLPAVPAPFDVWADQIGESVDSLLAAARMFLDRGIMRRFAAALHHRRAGISANCMVAWDVPAAQRDQFGRKAASFPAVTHCYQRPTYDDWPWSVFTMVHASSRPQCDAIIDRIAAETGITRCIRLYSTREFKKSRLFCFDGRIEAWEQQAAACP